jgi:hypothetical protein
VSKKETKIKIEVLPGRGGLAPQILVGFFFKGPPKKKGQKEQSKVQNSSANVLANKRKGNK